jgi:hypothetical protein
LSALNVTGISSVGAIYHKGIVYDINASAGSIGQILSSTGSGVAWTTGGVGGGTIGGSISADQVPFGNGANSITGLSTFVFVGGNLGIGTNKPYSSVSIKNNILLDSLIIGIGTIAVPYLTLNMNPNSSCYVRWTLHGSIGSTPIGYMADMMIMLGDTVNAYNQPGYILREDNTTQGYVLNTTIVDPGPVGVGGTTVSLKLGLSSGFGIYTALLTWEIRGQFASAISTAFGAGGAG